MRYSFTKRPSRFTGGSLCVVYRQYYKLKYLNFIKLYIISIEFQPQTIRTDGFPLHKSGGKFLGFDLRNGQYGQSITIGTNRTPSIGWKYTDSKRLFDIQGIVAAKALVNTAIK